MVSSWFRLYITMQRSLFVVTGMMKAEAHKANSKNRTIFILNILRNGQRNTI